MEKDEVTIDGNRKTVVHHELGEDGIMRKITKIYEIKRMARSVAQRREWAKFGDAIKDGKGINSSTTAVAEEVYLTLGSKDNTEQFSDNPLPMIGAQHKMVSCRFCKGDHWSTKCPYKDTLGATNMLDETKNQPENTGSASPNVGVANPPGRVPNTGKYIPPSQRGEGNKKGEMMSHMRNDDEQAAIRVTNLSEDARESDLRELFGRFGSIQRVFLAKDRRTQQSKGFAFIHFSRKEDAQNAINHLDGFGYDHLILKVEWAKPSTPRQ
jgi:translation initiation factor 3 subunit G